MKKILLLMGLVVPALSSYADSQLLTNFLNSTQTMQANFSQTIVSGKKSRVSTGTMEIARPNKFRWEYLSDKQLIVSDAKRIYIYDEPLQQVTIKSLGQSIDKSPAAVLAGNNKIQNLYKVSDVASHKNGLDWVKIEPKGSNDNNGFQLVLMGFDASHKLSAMEFTDSFGNQTYLKFSNLKTAVNLPAQDFTFKIPDGVDVAEQ